VPALAGTTICFCGKASGTIFRMKSDDWSKPNLFATKSNCETNSIQSDALHI